MGGVSVSTEHKTFKEIKLYEQLQHTLFPHLAEHSLPSEKCKGAMLPQKLLPLSSVSLRKVQRAQDVERCGKGTFRGKFTWSYLTHKGNGPREGSAIYLVSSESLGQGSYDKCLQGETFFRMDPI